MSVEEGDFGGWRFRHVGLAGISYEASLRLFRMIMTWGISYGLANQVVDRELGQWRPSREQGQLCIVCEVQRLSIHDGRGACSHGWGILIGLVMGSFREGG